MNARLLRIRRPRPGARRRPHPAPGAGRRRAVAALATGLLVFAAAQGALVGVSFFSSWVFDPVYADKEIRLGRVERAAPAGAARVVLLGTSRTGQGFAAGRAGACAADAGVSVEAFNFGIPGAGPITHLVYLKRLLAAGHRPDLLVVEVLPPLLADAPGGPIEGRLLAGDLLTRDEIEIVAQYGVPTERLRRQWRGATVLPAHGHRFKLLGRLFPDALPVGLRCDWGRPPDPHGWGPAFADGISADERARGTARAADEYRGMLSHELPAGPAAAALRDLLALCRAERVPAALVLFPEATAFRSLYPSEVEPRLTRFLSGLSAEFGCPVTDARAWMADEDFSDGHHLVRSAAERFSDRFAREALAPPLRAREPREGGP